MLNFRFCLPLFLGVMVGSAAPTVFHVSTQGSDAHDGLSEGTAFASPERAQLAVRAPGGKGATVYLHGGNFVFERNIVYWTSDQELLRRPWPADRIVMRRNLYWRAGGPVRFGPQSWEDWQARGLDEGSMVADPLFVDAALKIGFEPFDLAGAGVRDEKRAR